jgi:hypothetical protein
MFTRIMDDEASATARWITPIITAAVAARAARRRGPRRSLARPRASLSRRLMNVSARPKPAPAANRCASLSSAMAAASARTVSAQQPVGQLAQSPAAHVRTFRIDERSAPAGSIGLARATLIPSAVSL